jgi:hypothetical protein
MAPVTGALGVALAGTEVGLYPSAGYPSTTTGAMSRTVLAPLTPAPTPRPGPRPAPGTGQRPAGNSSAGGARRAVGSASRLGWLAGSIGYIYVYLREKVDAGERRRRLIAERDGTERLLAGALKELGLTILKQGIQHGDLTGLLEAVGRADARRETATADIAASEKLLGAEEGRLGAQELVLESEWNACDKASREAEELIRGVSRENQDTATRLARTRDARARLERDADAADGASDGKQKSATSRHEAAGKKSEEEALETQLARLDQQLVEMRERSSSLRAVAQGVRAKLETAVGTRRSAGSAMKASIAAHSRERAEAEREVAELTEQLGRAASQTRPISADLTSLYQSIDRFEETLADRARQIATLDQSLTHYDHKKLLTGVGLLTSLFALTAAGLWVALRR